MSLYKSDNYKSWEIRKQDYPAHGGIEEQIKFILGFAVLAPSTFNSQPWKCKLKNNELKIYLDEERLTKTSDTTSRFAHISMGCFIENLRIASEYFGWKIELNFEFKKLANKKLIATMIFCQRSSKKINSDQSLFNSIKSRVTNRSLSIDKKIPENIIKKLKQFTINKNEIVLLNEEYKNDLIPISLLGDKNIWTKYEFRKEHVDWIRTNITKKYDGMPAYGVGIGLIPSFLARPVVLSPIFPRFQALKNKKAIESSNNFIILCGQDNANLWVKIGMYYERIALYLAVNGLAVAPFGQFVEDDKARKHLKNLITALTNCDPQLFFRFGYPSKTTPHSPRIPVDQIFLS